MSDKPTRYSDLEGYELITFCGDNGHRWAEAFMEIIMEGGKPIDYGLMLAWFCNVIEASNDVREREKEQRLEMLNELD